MMPKVQKFLIIMALTVMAVTFLPSAVEGWAEANSNFTGTDLDSGVLIIPSAQGEGSGRRSQASIEDMIVRFGEEAEDISVQSDNSGIEVVPGAAFVHTGELDNSTQANDWFFLPIDENPDHGGGGGGYLLNDSATNPVCLMAPVYLPENSIINSFTVYLFDNFGPSNVTIFLDRTNVIGGWNELARVQSTNSGAIQALTDPSILNTDNANVVQSFYNYHVGLCLPAGSGLYNIGFGSDIRVLGAQVNYTLPATFTGVYLPVVLKPGIPTIQFSVKNETGGVLLYYTVLNTPQGTINCQANIPNGATVSCGTFNAGTYTVNVRSNGPGCGPGTGPLSFPPGSCTRIVRCGRNPSVWQCN